MTISSPGRPIPGGLFGCILRARAGVRANLLVGLAAAACVLVSIASVPGIAGILGASLAVLMLIIAVIDRHSFVIPDGLNAAALVLALVQAVVQEPDYHLSAMLQSAATALLRGVALALVFLLIRNVYARIRGRQGLGLGDVKLAGVAGAWLGWSMMPIAMEIAALAALSVYVLRQILFGQPMRATNRVPFGLFFAPAIWICWVLEAMGPGGF